jgi:hypothetical protein
MREYPRFGSSDTGRGYRRSAPPRGTPFRQRALAGKPEAHLYSGVVGADVHCHT